MLCYNNLTATRYTLITTSGYLNESLGTIYYLVQFSLLHNSHFPVTPGSYDKSTSVRPVGDSNLPANARVICPFGRVKCLLRERNYEFL